jgi:two-component system phosphate regulon sensor histidine kinase PhoR
MLGESLSLGRVPDPEKQKMFLDRILQATHRLGDLVERVLFLVKFGQGTVRLASLPVDMAEVVRVSVQTIEARHLADVAEDRPFVSVNMAGGLPNVTGDRGALEQVLMNLLDNAVKYGGKSDGASGRAAGRRFGQAPAVEVSADVVNLNGWRHRGSHVRIRVADSGIGLSRRELRRLFVPFFRGDSARAANLSGVGLGLAVSRDIVRRHCGWIEARGEKGKGSVFSVFLPVA